MFRRTFLSVGYALSAKEHPREVWLDQDGGWEDVVALAILLRSTEVKVMGITITPGIATPTLARERVSMLLGTLQEREARIVDEIPAGADILATGPLTRIARLIRLGRAPKLLTWMGGAVGVKGNAKGGAEWNAAADAGALRVVLGSKVPFTICPLDLTNEFGSRADLVSGGGTLAVELRKAYGESNRYYWDELAAASIVAPGLFRDQQRALSGMPGGRLVQDAQGRTVRVLTHCDRAGFEELLSKSLRF